MPADTLGVWLTELPADSAQSRPWAAALRR
jgi:hypothetical protein